MKSRTHKDFDKVLEDEFGVCLIHGEAGVGKAHLVLNVARREAQILKVKIGNKVSELLTRLIL
jgi:predicted ATP-dependent serine protease